MENFARIHHQKKSLSPYIKEEDHNEISAYAANITMNPDVSLENSASNKGERVPDIDTITIDIPSDVFRSKMTRHAKDFDSISMASSTHFTVVNGIGRPPKVPKSGLCDRGHQITVLIVTMSIFFMIGISLAVYFMESESLYFGGNCLNINLTLIFHFSARSRDALLRTTTKSNLLGIYYLWKIAGISLTLTNLV